jgi:hypothetical protein
MLPEFPELTKCKKCNTMKTNLELLMKDLRITCKKNYLYVNEFGGRIMTE